MKTSLALLLTFAALSAHAQMSLSGSTGGTLSGSPTGTLNSPSSSTTTTSMPSAGTTTTTQTAGPMTSAPNGSAGTFGYPTSAVDPNTTNPGLPQQPNNYGGPYYNYGGGTNSGTTTSINPAGAPFVAPPAQPNPNLIDQSDNR